MSFLCRIGGLKKQLSDCVMMEGVWFFVLFFLGTAENISL